jgi:DNA-binding CsgD family transcriptional regulator
LGRLIRGFIADFEIKEIANCETEEGSDYLERLYILIYDSMNPKVGYNMTAGGDRPSPSPETRERQRQKLNGRVVLKKGTTVLKIGRKASVESKIKVSESLKLAYKEGRHNGTKGRKAPQEEKDRQSKRVSGKGHPNFNHKICSEELLFLWNSGVKQKDIAKHFGLNVETVRRRIKATGLPYRIYDGLVGKNSPKYKEVDEVQLTSLFYQNLSLREIGKRLGRSHHIISQRIKALGLIRN